MTRTVAPDGAVSDFAAAILAIVDATRPGELVTYGEVAAEAGHGGAGRAVGRVLRRHGADSPWWRVITADGRLVPGAEDEHAARLAAEGIRSDGGRVVTLSDPLDV